MIVPKTCYAKSGELSIAYQVVGEGPFDVVFVPGFTSNLDIGWEMPAGNLYRRIASFARLIIFDKRGTGLSDRNCGMPSLEERIDDVRAVMAAVGSERASIFGFSEGSAMALMFAATYPDRTRSLVLYGAQCNCPGWVMPALPDDFDERIDRNWGTGAGISFFAPSVSANPDYRELWARYERSGGSPSAIKALARMNKALDVGPILGSVKTSCLLLHRTGDRACSVEVSRNLAKHLPNARFIELPGDDHAPVGDTTRLFDEIEEFLTGSRPVEVTDRVLATVLFTDIVDSTAKATELGDRRWRELLDAHDRLAAHLIDRHRGKLVKSTGDGILATFDGPGRGVRCALALGEAARQVGLPLRAGLHTGEVEVRGNDVGGIAVHVAARVMGQSGANEVMVSRVVTDLVAGAGLKFADRGSFDLKGIAGPLDLFAALQ
jgi:class 3 adenylate cyclase